MMRDLRSLELEKFSENASRMLLDGGRLKAFFDSLAYRTESYGQGLRGVCPACGDSAAFIGLRGKHHTIFWRCYDHQCFTNQPGSGTVRNLLGLVRHLVEDKSLGTAIKAISRFLGYEGKGASFAITNGKTGERG